MAESIGGAVGESIGGRVATTGVLAILLGALALIFPDAATSVITFLVGVLLIVGGVLQVSGRYEVGQRSWLAVLVGIAYIAVGVLFLVRPNLGALSLTVVLGILLLGSGAFRLAAAITGEVANHRVLVAISGVCSIALGWMAIKYLPAASAWLLGIIAGVDMLFDGVALFGTGRKIRRLGKVTA